MDILSHGLWGGILVGRRSKKSFWTAFAFGVLPDFLVFAPIFLVLLGSLIQSGSAAFSQWGPPSPDLIPDYVFRNYSITHSFVVFAAAFLAVWAARRKPMYEMLAWAAHILLDLPTHSADFFPTPYLWPFTHPVVDGVPWSHPMIFFPNAVILAALYAWHFSLGKRYRRWKAGQALDKNSSQTDS